MINDADPLVTSEKFPLGFLARLPGASCSPFSAPEEPRNNGKTVYLSARGLIINYTRASNPRAPSFPFRSPESRAISPEFPATIPQDPCVHLFPANESGNPGGFINGNFNIALPLSYR